jgi:thioredoxin-related protein
MKTRRQVLAAAAAAGTHVATVGRSRAEAPMLGDDGLYRQSWFIESFLELGDDLEAARARNKRLAVMWELKGCPYCRETHLVNFARPDIADYVRSRFDVLQLNIIGARTVTDFDGSGLGEKQLAARYGVRFTPTIQFFPEAAEGLADRAAERREVARLAGYYRPDDFLAMFRFVAEKAYERQRFREFLKGYRS